MSLLSRMSAAFFERRGNPLDNPAVPLSAAPGWLASLFGGGPTSAGIAVTEQSAMQLATVYSAVNVITSDVSSLPLETFEVRENGTHPADDSDLWQLLAVEPNPEMTAPAFLSTWLGSAVLGGNGYAEIQRDGAKPLALWPRHPRSVQPKRRPDGTLYYQVTINGRTSDVAARDMLHLPGLSLDGWVGLSPIQAARETIATAIATERYGAGFFGRGSRPSGLLTGPEIKQGQAAQQDTARQSWERANSGDNQGRTAVLPNGWTWTAIGISPDDAQFLETQQYTRSQIAALFRVPPHMVGDTSRLSNSNHESQALEYVNFTLRPWMVRMEAEVQRKLTPSVGRSAGRYTVRFNVEELLRGDFNSRMNGFAVGRQWGFYNANEIRQKLGENPIGKQGDMYLVPLNMVAAESVSTQPAEAGSGTEGTDSAGDGESGNNSEPSTEATPKGNGGRNQRLLMARMAEAYGGLFRDAVGRAAGRQQRDAATIARIFDPVLGAIAGEAERQARAAFRLGDAADLGSERVLRDYRKALEKRAADWTTGSADEVGTAELDRAVRAVTLGIFREAGASVALAA